MELIDGKKLAADIREELRLAVEKRREQDQSIPHLAAILVGDDPASHTYVNAKVKACEQVGFQSTLKHLPADVSEAELLEVVAALNQDTEITGFIVQVPLPHHIDEQKILLAIDPEKDVDGFHPENMGRMLLGLPGLLPATPKGILEMLDRTGVETEGKHCVVIGRSHNVGTPISLLLSRNAPTGNGTVTITHSRTKQLAEIARQADILVAAVGRPGFVTADMVKPGAVVIDVGIHRKADDTKKSGFRLVGDVEFETVSAKASFISPVPGGVGPMTVASLLQNTLLAAQIQSESTQRAALK